MNCMPQEGNSLRILPVFRSWPGAFLTLSFDMASLISENDYLGIGKSICPAALRKSVTSLSCCKSSNAKGLKTFVR